MSFIQLYKDNLLWRKDLTDLFVSTKLTAENPSGQLSEQLSEHLSAPRDAVLDGVRAIAILLVILLHSTAGITHLLKLEQTQAYIQSLPNWLNFAWQARGSDIIFILCGLLVSLSLFKQHKMSEKIDIKSFYLHRLLRIYPLFLIALVIYLPANADRIHYLAANLLFITNWIPAQKNIVPIGWSLNIQMQFYFFLPFMLMALLWIRKHLNLPLKIIFALALGIFVLWLRLRAINASPDFIKSPFYLFFDESTNYSGRYGDVLYYNLSTRIGPFLLGILLAYHLSFNRQSIESHFNSKPWLPASLFLLALGIIYTTTATAIHNQASNFYHPFYPLAYLVYLTTNSYLFCLGVSLLLLTVLIPMGICRYAAAILAAPFWRPIAKLIYPIYLFHFPCILIAAFMVFQTTDRTQITSAGPSELTAVFAIATMLSICLSLLPYLFIERPFIAMSKVLIDGNRKNRQISADDTTRDDLKAAGPNAQLPITHFSVKTFFLAIGLASVSILFLWYFSLWMHDTIMSQRARYDLYLASQQQSPFNWRMDSEKEVLHAERHSLADEQFYEGKFHLSTSGDDPYFWLNLDGRILDARKYNRFSTKLYADQASQLQLVFTAPTPGKRLADRINSQTYISENIEIKAGWQEINLSLDRLHWYGARHVEKTLAAWGGDKQLVSGFRIDPVLGDGIKLELDWVKLEAPTSLPLELQAIYHANDFVPDMSIGELQHDVVLNVSQQTKSEADLLNWLAKNRDRNLILFDTTLWRTTESTLAFREKILQATPSAIFFPGFNKDSFYNFSSSSSSSYSAIANSSSPDNPAIQTNLLSDVDVNLASPAMRLITYLLVCLSLLATCLNHLKIRKQDAGQIRLLPSLNLAIVFLHFTALWLVAGLNMPLLVQGAVILSLSYFVYLLVKHQTENPNDQQSTFAKLGFSRASPATVKITIISTMVLVLALLIFAIDHDTLKNIELNSLLQNLIQYPLWAIVQLMLLGPVVAKQIQLILYNSELNAQSQERLFLSALFAGFIFSLSYAPSFTLMGITYFLGVLWSYLYLKYRTIIPLAVAHGVLTALFIEVAPWDFHIDSEIGLHYYHWLWSSM